MGEWSTLGIMGVTGLVLVVMFVVWSAAVYRFKKPKWYYRFIEKLLDDDNTQAQSPPPAQPQGPNRMFWYASPVRIPLTRLQKMALNL